MSRERLYILIGLFVGGAISLIVLTGLFFYDEYLYEKETVYVMFFNGTLEGLEATSKVTYRGVKIGQVKHIEITEDEHNHEILIPVFVRFYVENAFIGKKSPIEILINKGFVANVRTPNFLTGTTSIEIIKSPSPTQFKQASYKGYPIFPTSIKPEDYKTFDETLAVAKKTFEDIGKFINSKRVHDTLDAAKNMADSFDRLANKLDQQVSPLFSNVNQSLSTFNQSLSTFDQSLEQISSAANSTQNLTDYLARYPESLLRGKQ